MNLDELRSAVDAREIDTVLLAIVDMQGRLQGKRLTATHFLNEVVPNNAEGCNYLLAVDVEMNTVEGYSMSSWERGYGDFVMVPDFETLIRRIRNEMAGAGLIVENSKGECNFGQHEINFRYAYALDAADGHAIYKTGAKEIAAQEGMAITFMAKYDEREGNSCHIHLSLAGEDGSPLFADSRETFERFVAGAPPAPRGLTPVFPPNADPDTTSAG